MPSLRLLIALHASVAVLGNFEQADVQQYLDEWNYLVAESYSAPLPDALRAQCSEKGSDVFLSWIGAALPDGTATSAAAAQSLCGATTLCVVPVGATLRMDGTCYPHPDSGPRASSRSVLPVTLTLSHPVLKQAL